MISPRTNSEPLEAQAGTGPIARSLSQRVLGGRFALHEPLGGGRTGFVYRAIQAPLDRVVAVKVLDLAKPVDSHRRERFLRVASSTSKLRHPNTVTVIDYGEAPDGLSYVVMEYLDGRPLSSVLAAVGTLPWARAWNIAHQVSRSVREAHRLGILHGDLRPENIMLLTEDGDQDLVKVMDFGLAQLWGADTEHTAPSDVRDDVYSLGVLLFRMLAGRPPALSGLPGEADDSLANDAQLSLISICPEYEGPEEIGALVMRCLHKDPLRRFASMDEVLESMRSISVGPSKSSSPAPAIDIDEISLKHDQPREPRMPLVLAPVVALAVGLLVAFLISFFHQRHVRAASRSDGKLAAVAPASTKPETLGPTQRQAAAPPMIQRAEYVKFRISSQPRGARVNIDGRDIGTTPLTFERQADSNGEANAEIVFTLKGYQPLTVITGGSGPTLVLTQKLQPIASAHPGASEPQRVPR